MWNLLWDWFRAHEWVAIWLEGIALVAIFIWDRIDTHSAHAETLRQLAVSQQQVGVSQKQVEVAQKQVEAALEQVEASHKPFLTLSTTPRDAAQAALGAGQIEGGMMLLCPGAQAQLENVGDGPAINIRYRTNVLGQGGVLARPSGYLIGMIPGQKFLLPIAQGLLQNNEWEIIVEYESLSGRKYRTTTIANNLVLTSIQTGELK